MRCVKWSHTESKLQMHIFVLLKYSRENSSFLYFLLIKQNFLIVLDVFLSFLIPSVLQSTDNIILVWFPNDYVCTILFSNLNQWIRAHELRWLISDSDCFIWLHKFCQLLIELFSTVYLISLHVWLFLFKSFKLSIHFCSNFASMCTCVCILYLGTCCVAVYSCNIFRQSISDS